MNIEEGVIRAKTILDNHREIDKMMVIEMVELVETLLTAYEKEKENTKELRKYYATRKEVEELREINECLHDSAENYIHKDKIKEIIYPTPENYISIEVQQSEMYKKLLKEVEE